LKVTKLKVEEFCQECKNPTLEVQKRDLEFYTQLIVSCPKCGFEKILPPRQKKETLEPTEGLLESPLKPVKRLRGISAKESRRLYSKTPAGKAAWLRYRRSKLFSEAHARHRQTEKYKETQQRYHDKIKLFKKLLYPKQKQPEIEYTCPLKLFRKIDGVIFNHLENCDYNSEIKDCSLKCLHDNS